MSVEHILAEKGRAVETISPDTTIGEAAAILSGRRIGAVVVVDGGGAVLGIVSERDVVRALADVGADAMSESVSDRMTRKVVTCSGKAAIPELMELMTSGKFRHVPVVDDGRLGGIVSIGDIVKHRLAEMETEHQALREYIATA